jgi:hypothetical protein
LILAVTAFLGAAGVVVALAIRHRHRERLGLNQEFLPGRQRSRIEPLP